jgi:hypothetical protein
MVACGQTRPVNGVIYVVQYNMLRNHYVLVHLGMMWTGSMMVAIVAVARSRCLIDSKCLARPAC